MLFIAKLCPNAVMALRRQVPAREVSTEAAARYAWKKHHDERKGFCDIRRVA